MIAVASYDADTFLFEGIFEAPLDPLESEIQGHEVPLVPAHSTLVLPPKLEKFTTAKWNPSSESWDIIEDHRNQEYWLPTDTYRDEPHIMKEVGPLPEGAVTQRPEKTQEEILTESEFNIRAERDTRLHPTLWMSDRHRSQIDGGISTTLTSEQYKELCSYQQALRDVPQQQGFPWDGNPNNPLIKWPPKPSFVS